MAYEKMGRCEKHKIHVQSCDECLLADLERRTANVEPKEDTNDYHKAYEKIVGYPCQRGVRCEWASYNGTSVSCLRVAGCVKVKNPPGGNRVG